MAIKSIYGNAVVGAQDSQGIRGIVVKAFVVITKEINLLKNLREIYKSI